MKLKMTLVPNAAARNRLVMTIDPPETIFFWGHGINNYICGNCGTDLAKNINAGDFKNQLFKCNGCECINKMPVR